MVAVALKQLPHLMPQLVHAQVVGQHRLLCLLLWVKVKEGTKLLRVLSHTAPVPMTQLVAALLGSCCHIHYIWPQGAGYVITEALAAVLGRKSPLKMLDSLENKLLYNYNPVPLLSVLEDSTAKAGWELDPSDYCLISLPAGCQHKAAASANYEA